jgi:hypothetical protein
MLSKEHREKLGWKRISAEDKSWVLGSCERDSDSILIYFGYSPHLTLIGSISERCIFCGGRNSESISIPKVEDGPRWE